MVAICHLPRPASPNDTPGLRIRIKSAPSASYWYAKRIGETVDVEFKDSYGYWAREGGIFNPIHWIRYEDADVVASP